MHGLGSGDGSKALLALADDCEETSLRRQLTQPEHGRQALVDPPDLLQTRQLEVAGEALDTDRSGSNAESGGERVLSTFSKRDTVFRGRVHLA